MPEILLTFAIIGLPAVVYAACEALAGRRAAAGCGACACDDTQLTEDETTCPPST